MTFEGFDAAPLIEGAGFSPLLAGGAMILIAGADGTLEAALRAAGPGPRAAPDPHDLWVGADRGDIFERGWRGRAAPADPDRAVAHGAGDLVPHAIFADDVDGDGEEDAPITVTGRRNVSEGSDGDIGGNYGAGFYPGTGGIDGEMSGGSSVTDPQEPNDCRDRKAIEAQTLINGEPDDQTREHGAVIYRGADGRVQVSDILEGDASHVPPELITAWLTAHGVSWSQVIGFVHNHDPYYYARSPEEATMNRYPSGNDWNTAGWMVANGAGGPNGENFALYVIDTNTKMREFEYEDRSIYTHLDDGDKERGSALPHVTVSDGSSCG